MKINWFYVIVAVLFCAAIYFLDVGLHFLVKKLFCMVNIGNIPLAGLVQPNYSSGVNHASIIGAALGAGGSIVNGLIGAFSQNKANKLNAKLQREANDLNYQMFQEGNEFNRQMAFDMFNAENAYNDPSAQAERLRNAGMNPALVAENATATTGNASGSAPSSVSPSPMLAPQMQPLTSPFSNIFTHLEQLASAFEKVESGHLHEGQKQFVLEQAKSEILDQKSKEISIAIAQAFGMEQADASVKKTLKEIEELDGKISLYVTQGKLNEAEAVLKDVQKVAEDNKNSLFDRTFEYLVQQEVEKVNLIRAEVKTEESKQSANYASAEAARSSAALNRQLVNESVSREDLNKQQYDYIEDTMVWTKQILENDAMKGIYDNIVNKETIIERIQQLKNLPGLQEQTKEIMDQQIELLKKQNNWYNRKAAVELIRDICGAYESYTGSWENVTGAGKNVVNSVVPFYLGK